jgi:hypothetical protein
LEVDDRDFYLERESRARAVWNSTDRIVEGDVVFGLINIKYNRPASLLVFR